MKIYLSGPVTGLPADNRPAFDCAANSVRSAGHEPIVPHDHVAPGATWEQAMRSCLRVMMDADALLMLPGWGASRGARVECSIAAILEIPFSHVLANLLEEASS